jgi:Protein of unknown function (DUF2911)
MTLGRYLLVTTFVVGFAAPLAAQESGSFIVRLGTDTTAVETYTRTGTRTVVDQVGRAPRVLKRHYEFEVDAQGVPTKASALITSPTAGAGTPPVSQVIATAAGDSLSIEAKTDTVVRRLRVGKPADLVVNAGASPWSVYELLSMKRATNKADSVRVPLYQLGANGLTHVTVAKLGNDSVSIQTGNDRYHAKIDATGRIQRVVPVWGTVRVEVDRVASVDLAALTSSFAAREQSGAGIGPLSTRDTTRATAGGATLWIDYGRPAKRGRTIYGTVVPYGELWRTGANAATQFRTDKDLVFGAVTVPAGFYSLFTVPGPTTWKLIFNSETGISGTAHKAEKDVHTVEMKVSPISTTVERFTVGVEPAAQGGTLYMDWDNSRASIPFTVKP